MFVHTANRADQSTFNATWRGVRGAKWARPALARLALIVAALAICGANEVPVPAAIPIIIRPTSPPPNVLPRIDRFTPLSGPVGTRITITGVNLSGVATVQISGVAAPVLSKTTTTVLTSVPNGARSGDITVTTGANDTARSAAEFIVIETRVQSFSPSSGPPDTIVNLSGSGLGNATQVKFGSVTAPILFKNDNQITTKVPATAPASDFITVVTPTGNPKTDRPFGVIARVVAPPSITRLTPTSGPVGTVVVIAGANLSGVTSVKFNGVSANFDVVSPTEIRAIVPSGATTGRVSVTRGTLTAQSTVNFSVTVTTSTTRSIIGRITNSANSQLGIANVIVRRYQNGRFEEKRTDASGNYVFTNVAAGDHLIIPIQSGIVFSNAQNVGFTSVTVGAASISGVNFKGRQVPGAFSIAGKITNRSGAPVPGVYVFASNLLANGGAMTNDRGEYLFTNLPAGLYIFYPVKSGHVFDPPSRAGNLSGNSAGNDFRSTTAPTPPPNDAFATPQVLSGNSGRATGSNANATKQAGEPNHANIPTGQSLWYRWRAPANGFLTLTTAGSTTPLTTGTIPTDTVVAVYSGTAVNALTAIGANNDVSTTDRTSRVVVNVVAGRTYLIAVDTPYFLFGNLVLNYSFSAATAATPTPTPPSSAPANDLFSRAQVISGTSGRTTGRTSGATKETGEPIHNGNGGGHSVWYRWTAPGNGVATFTTAGSTFDSIIAVYTGTAVGTLTKIVSNDDASSTVGTSSVSFAATSGRVYLIAVDGFRTAVGNLTLNWSQLLDRGPRNNNFVSAQLLSGGSGRATGTNVDATKETGEPLHNGNAGGKSVWYRWTATNTGTATFDTGGSTFDTILAVYTGSTVNALTRLASDDDSNSNRTSRVSFSTVAGRAYYIAVEGYNGVTGNIVLNWSASGGSGGSPANNNFANAQALSGTSGRATGNNVNATRESGEPLLATVSQGKSIWYRWTAPSAGSVSFNTNGSGFDTILGVYTGASLSTLTRVAADNDSGDGLSSLLSFTAVAGTSYFIQVADATGGATGAVVLNWALATSGTGSNEVLIFDPWSWTVSGSTLTLSVDEIFNDSTTAASNNLRLELWAFPARFTGAAQSGFQLGVANVGTLAPQASLTNVVRSTTYQPPAPGTYFVTLFIMEQSGSQFFFSDFLDDPNNPYVFSTGTAAATAAARRIPSSSPAPLSGSNGVQSTLIGPSPVVLSTATARGDSIELRFTGALDVSAAGEVSNYEVESGGDAIAVQSTLVSSGATQVSLQLARALRPGERVVLRHQRLRDAQNRVLPEATVEISAR